MRICYTADHDLLNLININVCIILCVLLGYRCILNSIIIKSAHYYLYYWIINAFYFFFYQISQGSFSGDGNQFSAENLEKKFYKCCNCGTAFVRKGDLERHLKLMCRKTHWQCPYCPRTARAKAHLKQHITHVHTKSAQRVKQISGYTMFQ